MSRAIAILSEWFFTRGDASAAAAVRVAFAGCYLFMLWDLYPVRDLLLGHSGYFGTLDPRYVERGALSLLFHHDSPLGIEIAFGVAVLTALLALVGLFTRIALPASMLWLVLLHQRNPFMLFGADMVHFHIGLWLMFLRCDRAWSIDSRIWMRGGGAAARDIALWPLRALQIQIALIYFRTAVTKVGTEPWQDGSAVYYALQTLGNDVFPQVMEHKLLLTFLTYATVLVEFAFPLLVFWKPTRWLAILSAALLHLGIDLMMSIRFFGPVMYAALTAFVLPDEWLRIEAKVRRWMGGAILPLHDLQGRDGEDHASATGFGALTTGSAQSPPDRRAPPS